MTSEMDACVCAEGGNYKKQTVSFLYWCQLERTSEKWFLLFYLWWLLMALMTPSFKRLMWDNASDSVVCGSCEHGGCRFSIIVVK